MEIGRRPHVRRMFSDMPIARKLTVITAVATAAALVFSGLAIIAIDIALYRTNLQHGLAVLAHIIADNSTAPLTFDDSTTARQTLLSLKARPHMVAACIYRGDGSVLAQYIRPYNGAPCPPPLPADEVRTTRRGLAANYVIRLSGKRVGTLVLLYDLDEEIERARLYAMAVCGVLIAASLFAYLISSQMQKAVTQPIANLVRTAGAVTRTKDYNLRAPEVSRDELSVLVNAFNQMLDGIQSRDVELRGALVAREAALGEAQDARDFLATTLASIGDAVIVTDVAGRIVLANRAAQILLRRPDSEIIGKALPEVCRMIDEFSRKPVENPVSRAMREGGNGAPRNHTMLLLDDGSETPIDETAAPIRDQNGHIQGSVLVFRDLTARRRADETGRLLASIVQSSDDAIIGHTLDGKITSWNHGAERIFGYSADQMIGQSSAVLAPPGRDEMPAVLERIRNGERVEQYYASRRTNAGAIIDVAVTVSPVQDALGRTIGASKIARDVTEQVRAAERLAKLNADLTRSNESLSRSNEDLERFAFIASHDFQEPLRMITIFSQLLLKSFHGQLDSKAAAFVDNIVNGTQRIRDLLADLLAYTEVGVRQEDLTRAFDLNDVLETAKANLQAAIFENSAVIVADRLPSITAYEGHFIAVFQNLIGNAIKYRGSDPPRIHISAHDNGDNLLVAVSDNGIGIPAEYHEKIFVAFKRLHGKQIPGTGIGLAICQRVVERYGGRIWVESKLGQGATFLFTIPNKIRVREQL